MGGQAVRYQEEGGTLVMSGVIDVREAQCLHAAAMCALSGEGPVSVDCASVERFDYSALQVLVALQRALAERGRALHMPDLSPSIERFLGVAGVASMLLQRAERDPSLEREQAPTPDGVA